MTNDPEDGGFLSDKQYNFFKFLTVVLFPAIGTLYFALATMWGLPSPEQVLGTILAVETFIGAVVGISTKQYESSGAKYSGDINIAKNDGVEVYSLELNHTPEKLKEKDEAVFKINTPE